MEASSYLEPTLHVVVSFVNPIVILMFSGGVSKKWSEQERMYPPSYPTFSKSVFTSFCIFPGDSLVRTLNWSIPPISATLSATLSLKSHGSWLPPILGGASVSEASHLLATMYSSMPRVPLCGSESRVSQSHPPPVGTQLYSTLNTQISSPFHSHELARVIISYRYIDGNKKLFTRVNSSIPHIGSFSAPVCNVYHIIFRSGRICHRKNVYEMVEWRLE